MNIVIFTNTYSPHVGGVARSIKAFSREYRDRGHRVLVVAPEFPGMPEHEVDVVRIPAIQNFNASDFSVALPIHPQLGDRLDAFRPDIVHSQHPFLLGMSAMRVARHRKLPLVFTHHTLYEQYTHYIPGDSPPLRRFAIELATRYANLCDHVFAPSESIRKLLIERGVSVPVSVVFTGVCLEDFAQGDGAGFRERMGIPEDAFVVGHLGRLAPEKNLEFLARAVAGFVEDHPRAHFLVIGSGPSEAAIRAVFAAAGQASRLHVAGVLEKQELTNALHAMNVFAFASMSETQGLVLTEAMAASLPIVALDATGVREVVLDGQNGRLLADLDPEAFQAALQWLHDLPAEQMSELQNAALATAREFSTQRAADKALACFEALRSGSPGQGGETDWEDALAWIKTEWNILKSLVGAGEAAITSTAQPGKKAG